MRMMKIIPLLLLPFLFAAKTDPYEHVASADRDSVRDGVGRYAKDQMKRDWADLYEIKIPGYDVDGDYDDLSGKSPNLSKPAFINAMDEGTSNGSLPYLQSFDLVSLSPDKLGYTVEACSKAQRETFHFKGIIRFEAYVSNGQVRFGTWRFIHSMPHSCSQTEDSN